METLFHKYLFFQPHSWSTCNLFNQTNSMRCYSVILVSRWSLKTHFPRALRTWLLAQCP